MRISEIFSNIENLLIGLQILTLFIFMEKKTVNLPAKRTFVQLDKLRGCFDCKDRKSCDRYAFVNKATDAIIEENGFEESFLGQNCD